ncbi:hypothetical protein L6803_015150, partial [Lactiplantibacillus plantarum]|uniref:hypothetical protein n=1 Tax=Lactiplantibacillus plantarum TaxID=1590 RepID=UPI001CA77D9E
RPHKTKNPVTNKNRSLLDFLPYALESTRVLSRSYFLPFLYPINTKQKHYPSILKVLEAV